MTTWVVAIEDERKLCVKALNDLLEINRFRLKRGAHGLVALHADPCLEAARQWKLQKQHELQAAAEGGEDVQAAG